jgi:hypothetical protein
VPGDIALIAPELAFTVATLELLELHVTMEVIVAPDMSRTVAVAVAVDPTMSVGADSTTATVAGVVTGGVIVLLPSLLPHAVPAASTAAMSTCTWRLIARWIRKPGAARD